MLDKAKGIKEHIFLLSCEERYIDFPKIEVRVFRLYNKIVEEVIV